MTARGEEEGVTLFFVCCNEQSKADPRLPSPSGIQLQMADALAIGKGRRSRSRAAAESQRRYWASWAARRTGKEAGDDRSSAALRRATVRGGGSAPRRPRGWTVSQIPSGGGRYFKHRPPPGRLPAVRCGACGADGLNLGRRSRHCASSESHGQGLKAPAPMLAVTASRRSRASRDERAALASP